MHKKPGYILFLLFSILSVCMVLMTLFFARSSTYQQLMFLLQRQNTTTQLAVHAQSLGQSLLYIENNVAKNANTSAKTDAPKAQQEKKDYDKKLLEKIFPFLYNNKNYVLKKEIEGIDALIDFYLCCENGKLNINSLYDFKDQKFIKEGQPGDRKKFCQWLFEQISKITKKQSLFDSFEKHIKTRTHDFNDVTELLHIKEFSEVFAKNVFYSTDTTDTSKIFLTDLFTVTTNQESINPWFFSASWLNILNIKRQTLSEDNQKKLIESYKKETNWDKDWDNTFSNLYQKEYKNLPQEIKSMLTTECEANIFSLLLNATIGETTSRIFTILKKRTISNTATFDIVKIYQI
ncbi:MAG: hypothetical protein CL947_04445 [Epsilonproteobacteria bacterium]|nr:hypothetical protein [Campylobacterota bacterium]